MTYISRIGGVNLVPNSTKINHTNVPEVKKRSSGDTVEIKHHMIDCDKIPFRGVDNAYYLKENHFNEWFEWNLEKVHLLGGNFKNIHDALDDAQKEIILLNANVLDYLLIHPLLIPDEWKHISIFFCGTVYGNYIDCPFVRYLYYYATDGNWYGRFVSLDGEWDNEHMFIINVAK